MRVETLLEKSELKGLSLDLVQGVRVSPGANPPDEYKNLPKNEGTWGAICVCGQDGFGFTASLQLNGEGACYTIAYSAYYRMKDLNESDVDDAVLTEFFNKVAFFLVYPYFRATLTQMAGNMEVPIPVLPVVQQGDVTFSGIEVKRPKTKK